MGTKKLIAIALVLLVAVLPFSFAEESEGFTIVKAEKAYFADNMFVLEFKEGLVGDFTYAVTDPDENTVAGPMTVRLSGQTEVNILPAEDAQIVPGKYQVKLVSTEQVVSEVVDVPILAERVDLDSSKVSMETGEQVRINATVKPDDAADRSLVWSSSDEHVVTVSQDGTITARGPGTATVTVRSGDGCASAECTVEVTGEPVPGPDGESGSSVNVTAIALVAVAVLAAAGVFLLVRSRGNR